MCCCPQHDTQLSVDETDGARVWRQGLQALSRSRTLQVRTRGCVGEEGAVSKMSRSSCVYSRSEVRRDAYFEMLDHKLVRKKAHLAEILGAAQIAFGRYDTVDELRERVMNNVPAKSAIASSLNFARILVCRVFSISYLGTRRSNKLRALTWGYSPCSGRYDYLSLLNAPFNGSLSRPHTNFAPERAISLKVSSCLRRTSSGCSASALASSTCD